MSQVLFVCLFVFGSVCLAGLSLVCEVGFGYLHGILLLIFLTLAFKNNLVCLKAGLQNCTASGAECAPCPALGFRVILSPG